MEKSECSHIFSAKPLAIRTGEGLYFSARCRVVSIFPLVALSLLVDVRRKCIGTNSGGPDMTGL